MAYRNAGGLGKEREHFFFEKKKQKLCFYKGLRMLQSHAGESIRKSFLVLFFEKELLPS
jgi:hypothetical protein